MLNLCEFCLKIPGIHVGCPLFVTLYMNEISINPFISGSQCHVSQLKLLGISVLRHLHVFCSSEISDKLCRIFYLILGKQERERKREIWHSSKCYFFSVCCIMIRFFSPHWPFKVNSVNLCFFIKPELWF